MFPTPCSLWAITARAASGLRRTGEGGTLSPTARGATPPQRGLHFHSSTIRAVAIPRAPDVPPHARPAG